MASSSDISSSTPTPTKPNPSKKDSNSKLVHRLWSSAKSKSTSSTCPGVGEQEKSSTEFRQRFLSALQFYCETPSLILNSDLPGDLVEFVTSQSFPVEALSVILELKKGSPTDPRASELSRKLVESWMSADSCSEALNSLSLGDEVPGIIAETSNLYRLLFSISDHFHIPSQDFQSFLLGQILLCVKSLVFGVKEDGYDGKIRSSVLSSGLERCFLRFHSDLEQFFTLTLSKEKRKQEPRTLAPFPCFVQELGILCKDDFISRRLVSKILLRFGNQTSVKFAKTVFLFDGASTILFFPSESFFQNPIWNHTLLSSIPLKTATKSLEFWSNWALFIYKSTSNSSSSLMNIWESLITNWVSLCQSSAVNSGVLLPATLALIGLAREIKMDTKSKSSSISSPSSTSKIFDGVAKCLDSTNEEKKACGMGLAQIIGDLHLLHSSSKDEEIKNKLRFTSSHPIFQELLHFYENGIEICGEIEKLGLQEKNKKKKKIQVLDSDDDEDENNDDNDDDTSSSEEEEEEENEQQQDYEIDERILTYRSKHDGKLPSYFSEILEILLEGTGNEGENDALKYYCIMRIPLLLQAGVRIDSNMATTIVKCLIDFESGSCIEIPVLFSLLELSSLYPTQVFDLLAGTIFNKEHYTSGHRLIILFRLSEIIQLLSKSKCITCFEPQLKKPDHFTELRSICPDFYSKYWLKKQQKSAQKCSNCGKNDEQTLHHHQKATAQEQEIQNLTWRQIVDRRIEGKTRYFFTPKNKTPIPPIRDDYSSHFVPILWGSLSNRIISSGDFFLDENERRIRGAPNDIILASLFRLLGRILLGLRSKLCPSLSSIATQVGQLFHKFHPHPDSSVRHALFALLAVLVTVSDGAFHIVEAISCGSNIFEMLKTLIDLEVKGGAGNEENVALLNHTLAYLTQAAREDYRLLQLPSSSSSSSSVYSKLCFLPDTQL